MSKQTNTKTSIQNSKNYITSFFTVDHKAIDVEGLQTLPGLSEPNVNDVTWESSGRQGKFHTEKELIDYPFEVEQYCKNVHLQGVRAVIRNNNPNSGNMVLDFNEENPYINCVSMRKEKESDGKFYWKDGCVHFNIQGMTDSSPIELSKGDVKTAYAGMSERAIGLENPVWFEGWGANVDLEEQATPNNTALISKGGFWGRRVSTTTIKPEKLYITEQNTPAITVVTADSRYDAIVAYKSGEKYTDTSITVVSGAEAASPVVPTPAAIEAAVDVLATNANWCILGYILVNETATVVVNTADISYFTQSVFTYDKTAKENNLSSQYFPFKYLLYVGIGGVRKENICGVTTETDTALTLSVATDKMVEIWLITDPYEVVC